MPGKRVRSAARKPRADAQRNRERILAAAKQAFTRSGAAASLDDIARQAGVGPGTLYRNFPSREALLEAVYRTEVEKLAAMEGTLTAKMPPRDALRAWLLLFVDAIAAKQIIASALATLVVDPQKIFEASHARLHDAVGALMARAIASGDIRPDVDPKDFIRALVGVATVATGAEWQPTARRLIDILIAGSQPVK